MKTISIKFERGPVNRWVGDSHPESRASAVLPERALCLRVLVAMLTPSPFKSAAGPFLSMPRRYHVEGR